MSPARHFFEDSGGGSGPDEGFGVGIVVIEVLLDGGFEFGDALEDTAANAVLGDPAKETLDLIEPDPEVGVKCIWKRGCRLSHALTLSCLWVA